ncbi:MAG: hypothetical protein AB7O26_13090 [Planctomycetaceae bacterium]
MKLSTSGLKNIDFKQLGIDHGEKAVAGLIALFVGYALYSTTWVPYDKAPQELLEKAEIAQDELNSGQWPDTDKKNFEPKLDVAAILDRLRSPVNSAKYAWNTPFLWSLYRRKEPINEPTWLPVDNMVADYGQALIPLLPEKGTVTVAETNDSAAKKEGEATADEDIPDEYKKKNNRAPRRSPGRASAAGNITLNLNRGDAEARADAKADQARLAATPQRRRGGGKRGEDRRADPSVSDRGRGHRFVAVRGVFPLHRQIKELEKAMHLTTRTPGEIEKLIRFQGFELERQTALRGAADPWTGPWEPVDLQVAKGVMTEASGWEDDTFSNAVISDVFTMPLPYREVGTWGELAGHKSLTEFELDEEEVERQLKINEVLLAKLKEEKAKEEKKVETQGFATLQEGIREQILDSGADLAKLTDEEFLKGIVNDSNPDSSEDDKKKMIERIKARISAAGNLLLFRYLDFEVQPGNTYRYRVRLVLFNPFLGRNVQEVLTPEIAEGQLRKTQWSEPTPPVRVPGDADYFVNKVDNGRRGTLPSAEIDLFQWSTETGTIVNSPVRTNVGQYLGGTVRNVYVNRPMAGTFEKENFKFTTDDILLDVVPRPSFERSLHPDVQLAPNAKEPVGITDQALVMNKMGDLIPIDQLSLESSHAEAKKKLDFQNRPFEDIKDALSKEKARAEGGVGKRDDDDKAEEDGKDADRRFGLGGGDNPRRKPGGGKRGR